MLFFGVDPLKAAVTAAVVVLAITYNYGRRALIRGGPWRYGPGAFDPFRGCRVAAMRMDRQATPPRVKIGH
jgi:hypothetical protein